MGYYNLNLDEQSSSLTTFSCPFCRYRYMQLLFGVAPANDMSQRKIYKLSQGLSNGFGIADNIFIAGFDDLGSYHDGTLDEALRICREANLKLNKFHFRCTSIPFFGEFLSWDGVNPGSKKVQVLKDKLPPECKKRIAVIHGYPQLPE